MSDTLVKRFENLVQQGTQLAPQGGFEFSGYNARLQNKYLEWRKSCLEALEQAGPIGVPYKSKILGDPNGGFFFQASAQLIVNQMKELFEKIKASPELAAAPAQAQPSPVVNSQGVTGSETGGARVLKPPPKKGSAVPPAIPPPVPAGSWEKKVYVIGEDMDPLRQQLSQFLQEIGLEEVPLNREHGKMLALDKISHENDIRFAFFVFNSDDLAYAMFELGHFVGKLGAGRVTVLHMTDVDFPKNVPGINLKPIVVKLEEASLSLMRELKSVGYQISL
ncbi:MAG: nucleotide-binding protein [Ignavibacteriales bacterium]|nr:nucleotide-binding protein [Ignavibacteriales bacterium]